MFFSKLALRSNLKKRGVYRKENVKNVSSGFDERVSVIPKICRRLFGATTERRALLLCPWYRARASSRDISRKGGGGPLEGEMEHEAREARPIGAQGAFVSNSMHYIYTIPPPRSPPPRSLDISVVC